MNNRKKIIYGIFMIGVTVLLYFSNSIIVSLDKINYKLVKSDLTKYESNSKVYATSPWIDIYENMLETMVITGVGGCETEFNNDNKKVKILLHSEDITYELDTHLLYSSDVNGQFSSHNIKGVNNGFSTEFSTLTMKNGQYKIYFYFWENEHNYGLTETDVVIEKTNKGIKQTYATPVESDIKDKILDNEIQVDDRVKVVLWNGLSVNQHNLNYTISGLAYIEGKDTKNQKVFVEFTDSQGNKYIYSTILKDNNWVKENIGEKYIYSNFIIRIAKEDINLEDTTMRILIENEGIYTSKDVFKYIVNEDQNGFKQIFEKPVDNFENVSIEDKMHLSLWSDIVDESNNDYYTISGIAYIAGKDTKQQEIYVEFKGQSQGVKTYKALLFDNMWLKENLGEQYVHGEFKVKIAKEDIEKEDMEMRIIIKNNDIFTNTEVFNYKFDKEQNKFIKVDK